MGKSTPAVITSILADPQARVAAIRSLEEGVGGTWVDRFFVRGTYDFTFVCDMPNSEPVAAMHAVVYSTDTVKSVSIHTELDIGAVASTASSEAG